MLRNGQERPSLFKRFVDARQTKAEAHQREAALTTYPQLRGLFSTSSPACSNERLQEVVRGLDIERSKGNNLNWINALLSGDVHNLINPDSISFFREPHADALLLAIVDTAFQTPAEDNESRRERARGALAIVLASVPLRELPMNSQQKIASLIPDAKSLPYTLDANPNSEYMCMQGEYRLSKVIPYNGVVLVDNQMLVKTMYGKVIGVSLNWAMTADGKIVVPGVWYSAGFEIGSTTAEAAIAASDQGNLRISLNTDKRYHWSCSRNLTNSHLPDTDIYDLITRTVAELPQNVSPIMTGLLGELTTREAFGGRGRRLRQVESL